MSYTLEVYTTKYVRLLQYFKRTSDDTYTYTGTIKECKKFKRKLAFRGIKGFIYPTKYGRSSDYRKIYFDAHPETITRCVYCGKELNSYKVTIDHVIPIYRLKRFWFSRFLLKLRGCEDANDINNLVASCNRCNIRKGTNLNVIYLVRARFGSNKTYWIIVKTLRFLFFCALMYMIYILLR